MNLWTRRLLICLLIFFGLAGPAESEAKPLQAEVKSTQADGEVKPTQVGGEVQPTQAEGVAKSINKLDLEKFMGTWYMLAGRFTKHEAGAFNGIETYKLDPDENNIKITYEFNKDSLTGEKKTIPQKGWVHDKESKAHWKVSPMWPIRFNYLILAIADDYSWAAVGVPDQKYLWIMARDWKNPEATLEKANAALLKIGYDPKIATKIQHQH